MSHKLVFVAQQLQEDPSIYLVVEDTPPNSNVHKLMSAILDAHSVGLDRVVFFDLGCMTAGRLFCREYIAADEMLLTEVYPVGWIMSAVPQGLGPQVHQALVPIEPPPSERTKMIVLHRKEGSSRTLGNLQDVLVMMRAVGAENGLTEDVLVLYSEDHDVFELQKLISRASIIVAPHGGQTYNVAFAGPGTIFIEVIPGLSTHDGPYTIHSYSASFGHDYWMLPIPGHSHRDEQPMKVPIAKLKQIMEQALRHRS